LKSDQEISLFEEISGSRIAWLILLYSVTTGAMIPGWIMNIDATKYLRISWRFFMQSLMMIPFVLYEYRTGNEIVREKYTFKYIFSKSNFIKPFASSLAASMWFTCILGGFEWTSVSHSLVLGSLSNFFLSLGRSWRKSSHDLESGGQILVIGGIILVVYDSITFGDQDYS
jgi:TRAP-type mannitol/chloroaromatic compound transport system permease small subunit